MLATPVEIGVTRAGIFEPVQDGGRFHLNFGSQGGVDTTVAVRVDVTALRDPRITVRIEDATTARPLGAVRDRPVEGAIAGVFTADYRVVFDAYANGFDARIVVDLHDADGRCEHGEIAAVIDGGTPDPNAPDGGGR